MAKYWVYLNDDVAGPYSIEELIRLRGFSRSTQVCLDDSSGSPRHWISPAEIPELAHIFKAADEQHATPPAGLPNKSSPKPATARPAKPYTPAVTLRAPARNTASVLAWTALASALVAGGVFAWFQHARQENQVREQDAAKALVENARLPAPSPYGSLQQYIQGKEVKARWEFEKIQDALYHVTLSWYSPALTVYAFEANVQAQTVRGLNTAAARLLAEGFPAPPTARPKPTAPPKATPSELFSQAIDSHREAIENGDASTVWNGFSERKKMEMAKGGISRDGFMRLQNLTHRVESAVKLTLLKTKQESDTERLVLIKQSQANRPDIFVKQLWVFENGAWKLDDEQKRSAETAQGPKSEVPSPKSEPAASDVGPRTSNSPSAAKPASATLPGMSN